MTPFNLLYPIPRKYFPAHRITKPYHAEVTYKVVAGKVFIEKVAFCEDCLEKMTGYAAFKDEMKGIIQKVEDQAKRNNHVPNTIMSTLAPFIKA